MTRLSTALLVGTFALASMATAQSAHANDDTFVSTSGTDVGNCQIAAPCATLRHALAQTNPGGTITILASGRYAPVTITKSVHIIAEGVQAIISGLAPCQASVCIDAGPTDVITLHGLNIELPRPYQASSSGILFANGGALHVEKCAIEGALAFGIHFAPSTASKLYVSDSKLAVGGENIRVGTSGGVASAVIDRMESHVALHGVTFNAGPALVQGTIRNSLIAGQGGSDIALGTVADAQPMAVMVDRSVLSNSPTAIDNRSGATIRIGDSTFSGHDGDFLYLSGMALSYGTNRFSDASLTKIPLK